MCTPPAFRDLSRIGADSSLHAGGQGFESPRLHQANTIKGFRDSVSPEESQKADAHPETDFHAALESFLLSRRVGN